MTTSGASKVRARVVIVRGEREETCFRFASCEPAARSTDVLPHARLF